MIKGALLGGDILLSATRLFYRINEKKENTIEKIASVLNIRLLFLLCWLFGIPPPPLTLSGPKK